LERHIKQVIDSFTGLQEGGLPPVAYATFDLDSGKRWIKVDVQRQVRSLITTYVPMLQVWGTSNHVFLEAPADTPDPDLWSRLYNLNMLIELQKNHPGLEIRFASPDWWREYFDLNCRGQICAADSFVNTFGFPFGFQKYNFAYDVSVPVLVEIRDKKAFGGEGYVFQYALEANIRSNEPFPVAGYNPNYPDAVFNESVPARSLLCEPEQRSGTEVTVNVVDGISGAPIDAAITFDCGDESCPIGETQNGKIVARFPRCAGGVINAIASERFGHAVPLNTNNEETASVTVTSEQIKEFAAEFKRVQFVKSDDEWRLDPAPTFAQKGDQYVVMLNREGEPDDQPFAGAVEYCSGATQNDGATARLVPGNYSINVLVLYHEPLVFPPQRQCADDTGQYCFTIPEEPLLFGRPDADCTSPGAGQPGPFLSGGSEYRWELTPQTFASGNTVIFKSLVAAIDKTPEQERELEDMDIVADLQDRSSAYTKILTPEVVNR
ncbi:MAG: hypothetical protein AABY13_01300, partial [Nanoarchaeota archaeon]